MPYKVRIVNNGQSSITRTAFSFFNAASESDGTRYGRRGVLEKTFPDNKHIRTISVRRDQATRTGDAVVIYIAGRELGSFGFSYGQSEQTISVPQEASSAGAEQSARYLVKSPLMNGNYTEAVRELTPAQISDLRNRGWTVEGTTRALQAAAKILGNPNVTTNNISGRKVRGGFGPGKFVVKSSPKYIPGASMPKSQLISPNRKTFSQPSQNLFSQGAVIGNDRYPHQPGTKRAYFHHGRNRNVVLQYGTAQRLATQAGWKLSLLPPGHVATRTGSTSINQEFLVENPFFNSQVNKYQAEIDALKAKKAKEQEDYRERLSNYEKQQEELRKKNSLIEQLQRDLQNAGAGQASIIQQEINRINQSFAATIERINLQNSQQTEQLISMFEQRLTQTQQDADAALKDLGDKFNAAGAAAGEAAGGIFGGVGEFFENNKMIILIVLAIFLIIMVKPKN